MQARPALPAFFSAASFLPFWRNLSLAGRARFPSPFAGIRRKAVQDLAGWFCGAAQMIKKRSILLESAENA